MAPPPPPPPNPPSSTNNLASMQEAQQRRVLNPSSTANLPQPTLPNVSQFLVSSDGPSTATTGLGLGLSHAANHNHNHNHHANAINHGMTPVPVHQGRTLTRPSRAPLPPIPNSNNQDSSFNSDPESAPQIHSRNLFNSLSLSRAGKHKRNSFAAKLKRKNKAGEIKTNPWVYASWALTCCFPTIFVDKCLGKKDPLVQQAWREKVALCIIIGFMMAIVGFMTFGFQNSVCPAVTSSTTHLRYLDITTGSNQIAMHGLLYAVSPSASKNHVGITNLLANAQGADVSLLFPPPRGQGACRGLDNAQYPLFPCTATRPASQDYMWPNQTILNTITNATERNNPLLGCHNIPQSSFRSIQLKGDLVYDYLDVFNSVKKGRNVMIYSGNVLDVTPFIGNGNGTNVLGPTVKSLVLSHIGKDASKAFAVAGLRNEGQCLVDYLKIATVDSILPACFASTVFVWTSLIVILIVVLAKFVLALYFTYVVGWRLGNNRAYQRAMQDLRRRKDEYSKTNGVHALSAANRPELVPSRNDTASTANDDGISLRQYSKAAPMTSESRRTAAHRRESNRDMVDASRSWNANFGFMDIEAPPLDRETQNLLNDPTLMHCIAMVPCYSEGRSSLKATLDSIATSYYPSTHKVLFVIADGIVKGSENAQSTPDILIDMIEVDERFRKDDPRWGGDAEAFSYVAIADGANRKNYAKVYAGWYKYDGDDSQAVGKKKSGLKRTGSSASVDGYASDDSASGGNGDAFAKTMKQRKEGRIPMLLIVKCGNEEERDPAKPAAKPGNRGKRDSQVILMNFLCKVMFDDRMTELEFDIFFKLFTITGVNPEKYECVLMVDADTRIYPDSLSHMVACLIRDDRVMGLCGETKILNKWDSWVTMIQVFEYFISHHMSKAFESVFGGVTCLPGCFSMYRIKSPKGPNGYWVPILANPDVVEEYSEHIVDTLHKKNLLLLGEDRFLSTMMLRQFPKRRMVFVPPAICKTVVPDTFKVLLSQRRRWINSTIHNLMELLLVKDLCGTFCISMQFIIFMDLVGTVVLPAAITFTFTILILTVTQTGADTTLPLILLALILGLPAILILLTANRPIYIFWMFVYLVSLPVWNFILPLYAFWHFDDFSWGATRKVSGEDVKHDHSAREGEFDGKGINMKRWSEWVQVIRAEHERQMQRIPMMGPVGFVPRQGSVQNGSIYSQESGVSSQYSGWNGPASSVGGASGSGIWMGPPGMNGPPMAMPPPSMGMYGLPPGVSPQGMMMMPPPNMMPPPIGIMPPPPGGMLPSINQAYRSSPLGQTPARVSPVTVTTIEVSVHEESLISPPTRVSRKNRTPPGEQQ
ncbi:hypothetical protein HDU79_006517 [Rhizoclosmatium sp. JEL0117]|nr:hypothetical protein HDU79_006517 [Rhizoclosmatium sp. JEL0117]